ncbi:hypothetical protein BJY01DRAFT_240556 [Aspergillus pseudoustus]|uniref:N-acetyltransferase domain-containing protein n=1 Tax=Aspergillus pseudoustus TaxID=1810923 RepID=A0ABR4IQ59_9EURO
MALSILPVEPEDVELLVRKVGFPAYQDNPLHRLMFPRSTEQQREDEIRWTIDGLLEAVHRGDEALYKACGEDGSPVGFIGWTTNPGASPKGMDSETSTNCVHDCPVVKSAERGGTKLKNWNRFTPPSLDVISQRVISSCPGNNGISRIASMAVDPNHQRQGVGSTLMKIFCDYVDGNELNAFVMSSPAGIRLYYRYGFNAVGIVETKQGNFTSMLRTSGSSSVMK